MTTNSMNSGFSTSRYSRGADGTLHVAGRVVVDSNDVRAIDELLPGAAQVVDTIDRLELSLLAFNDIDSALAALPVGPSLPDADPVEKLMARIRAAAARLEPPQAPRMGKERVVLGGEGWPYPSPKVPTLTPRAASGPFPDPTGAPEYDPGDAASGGTQGEKAGAVDDAPPVVRSAGESGSAVLVGILDSSVVNDDAFADVVHFCDSDSQLAPADLQLAWQGHGTFVTGLVHAEAPEAQIQIKAVLTTNGFATAWEAAKGMVELESKEVHVINMSIGCVTGDSQAPFALLRAVDRLSQDVVLVAAAGNLDPIAQGPSAPVWPAALPGVLAVGSITEQGVPSAFSPQEPWVDVTAVGEDVRSTFTTGDVACGLDRGGSRSRHFWGTAIWSGTSFAAATVTGRLAHRAGQTGGDEDPRRTIRDLADKLRTGRLPDKVVRQA